MGTFRPLITVFLYICIHTLYSMDYCLQIKAVNHNQSIYFSHITKDLYISVPTKFRWNCKARVWCRKINVHVG